jgi:hypothetical protein
LGAFAYEVKVLHHNQGCGVGKGCEIEDFVYQRNALTSFGVEDIAVIKDEK